MKPTINYISSLPGVGKTEWAVIRMKSCLTDKAGIILYVSPTKELLEEVAARLEKECPGTSGQVFIFHSDSVGNGNVVSAVTNALNHTKDRQGRSYKKIGLGCILLVTHQGFMNMHEVPRSAELELIFDESRKCIAQGQELKFSLKSQTDLIGKYLDIQEARKNPQFKRITAHADSYSKFSREIKRNSYGFTPKQILSVKSLYNIAANPRVEVFLRFTVDKKDGEARTLILFEVVLPSRIFEGFKRVTLLSAFFEESQMYHLLKDNRVKLRNISDEVPNHEKRKQAILSRYAKMTVIPLTPQQRVLTSTNQKMIMLSTSRSDLAEKLRELDITKKSQIESLLMYRNRPTQFEVPENYKQAILLIEKNRSDFVLDPVLWFVRQSLKTIERWSAENKKKTKKPLLILNKKKSKELPPELMDSFELLTTSVFGLNCYDKHDIVVFLAASNPTPVLINFYKIVLPSYEFDKDHIADVCIQCVCRSSVRDTNSDSKVLVILPDLRTAELLRGRMQYEPGMPAELRPAKRMQFLDRDYGKHTDVGVTVMTNYQRSLKYREKNLEFKRRHTLHIYISRYKKLIRESPEDNKITSWKSKLKTYKTELEKLV